VSTDDSAPPLDPPERNRLDALRNATGLADLVELTSARTEHGAYFRAKREWRDLRGKELDAEPPSDGLPGTCVEIDGREFRVHGVTHADTPAERDFLQEHAEAFRDRGAEIYCEQGIRSMYFGDWPGVCEMDDYLWAKARCAELDGDSRVEAFSFESVTEEVRSLAGEFQDVVFSLIDSGSDVYGDQFQQALGDVASEFLTDHADMATGDDFESFRKNRLAAEDPAHLADLQHYYERTFLPQPIEREWLRRHDRELELVTHARNERMADYVIYHAESDEVHLLVGAAHQPGLRYYLKQYRDGERTLTDFEVVG